MVPNSKTIRKNLKTRKGLDENMVARIFQSNLNVENPPQKNNPGCVICVRCARVTKVAAVRFGP